jgi:hypothetical protein
VRSSSEPLTGDEAFAINHKSSLSRGGKELSPSAGIGKFGDDRGDRGDEGGSGCKPRTGVWGSQAMVKQGRQGDNVDRETM